MRTSNQQQLSYLIKCGWWPNVPSPSHKPGNMTPYFPALSILHLCPAAVKPFVARPEGFDKTSRPSMMESKLKFTHFFANRQYAAPPLLLNLRYNASIRRPKLARTRTDTQSPGPRRPPSQHQGICRTRAEPRGRSSPQHRCQLPSTWSSSTPYRRGAGLHFRR